MKLKTKGLQLRCLHLVPLGIKFRSKFKKQNITPFPRLQNSRFFFSKSVKKSVKRGVRVLRARSARASHAHRARKKAKHPIFSVSPQSHSPFSASFQTFCLTARAYLNTQKYGLFCSPTISKKRTTFDQL